MNQVVTGAEAIYTEAGKHIHKLKFFGSQGQAVIKYILGKLRKYKTFFESNKTIASAVQCSVRTVQNAIKRAEQLEIFIVSSRYEETLDNHMRQTSNKIQLLAYDSSKQVVKKVVEKARKVKSCLVKKVTKNISKPNTKIEPKQPQQPKKAYNGSKKHIRTEKIPNWFNQNMNYESGDNGKVYTENEIEALRKRIESLRSDNS